MYGQPKLNEIKSFDCLLDSENMSLDISSSVMSDKLDSNWLTAWTVEL